MTTIHPTSVVDRRAELAEDVIVGPGAVIGPQVSIGARTKVGPFAVLDGHLAIGEDNRIFAHAVLGTEPQDHKYKDEPTRLELGDRNLIREFVTVHRGTPQGEGVTRILSDVFLMAYSHIAHDSLVGNHVVVANGAQIGGHVELGDHVVIGGCSAVHQFVRVGANSFIGGGSIVVMDVPPFCMATGNRAKLHGINTIGLKRRGFDENDLKNLRRAYRVAFLSGCLVHEAGDRIYKEIVPECEHARTLADFYATRYVVLPADLRYLSGM